MKTLPDKPIVFFDVDNTLVHSLTEEEKSPHSSTPTVEINGYPWGINEGHINLLYDFHARGHTIIVWSAGGSTWAKRVVEALDISHLITAVMPKPFWIVDDQPVELWLPESRRTFKPLKSFGGAR